MKKVLLISLSATLLSCGVDVELIGDLNMISNRNVNPEQKYELLKSYAGSSSKSELKKENKKVKAKNIQQAVDYTVSNVAGGEFLTNVKIYVLEEKYYVVRGDVWGRQGAEKEIKGWKIGDRVQYKTPLGINKGVIVDLFNANEASVKLDDGGQVTNIRFDRLIRDF